MKRHRTDVVSLVFGLIFLARRRLVVLAQLLDRRPARDWAGSWPAG